MYYGFIWLGIGTLGRTAVNLPVPLSAGHCLTSFMILKVGRLCFMELVYTFQLHVVIQCVLAVASKVHLLYEPRYVVPSAANVTEENSHV
jgi:hypothetical protein